MLEVPKDLQPAILLTNAAIGLKDGPFIEWLQDQLDNLDIDNRTETNMTILTQRQGAAQAISQIIELITNSRIERERLEGLRSVREQ